MTYAVQYLCSKSNKVDIVHIPAETMHQAIGVAQSIYMRHLEDNDFVEVRISKIQK
jgi:hypothetical protein